MRGFVPGLESAGVLLMVAAAFSMARQTVRAGQSISHQEYMISRKITEMMQRLLL